MLCGDEVQSVVLDIGHSISKFGTSGQDIPRHIFRSEVGCYKSSIKTDDMMNIDDINTNKNINETKYLVSDSMLRGCHGSNSQIALPYENSKYNNYTLFHIFLFTPYMYNFR